MRLILNYFKYLILSKNSFSDLLKMREDYIVNHKYKIFNFIWFFHSHFINRPFKIKKSEGILGVLNENDCKHIVNKLNVDGYFVFEQKLTDEFIDSIYSFASNEPINYLEIKENGTIGYTDSEMKYKETKNQSVRHQFLKPSILLKNDSIQKLFFDENLLHIADNYLKSRPLLDICTMWWTNPLKNIKENYKSKFRDSAALMFHYDLDRIKFLKFFFYITDVTMENGPHVYVSGSHNRPSEFLSKDGRYSDEIINNLFSKEIKYLTGKKGTIMAVDTRGLHKGNELLEGERLLFQIQFSSSLYGYQNYNDYKDKVPFNISSKYEKSYSLFVDIIK